MKYLNYVCKCFRHYLDFKGRANRTEFWSFSIFTMIVGVLLVWIDNYVTPAAWYQWHNETISLLIESLTSGYSMPYLRHWYEVHPEEKVGFGMITTVWALACLIPSIALGVRRLHDINMNGWFILVAYAPLVGWGWFFIYSLLRGSEGENNYGPEPEEVENCCCCKK